MLLRKRSKLIVIPPPVQPTVTSGQLWPNSGQFWPTSDRFCLNFESWARCSRCRHCLVKLVELWPDLVEVWPNSGQIGPAKFDRFRASVRRILSMSDFGPNLVGAGPSLADVGQSRPNLGHVGPGFDRIGPVLDPCQPASIRMKSNLGDVQRTRLDMDNKRHTIQRIRAAHVPER